MQRLFIILKSFILYLTTFTDSSKEEDNRQLKIQGFSEFIKKGKESNEYESFSQQLNRMKITESIGKKKYVVEFVSKGQKEIFTGIVPVTFFELIKSRLTLYFLIIYLFSSIILFAAQVKLPGTLENFQSYTKSFSANERNLIYYLNEILLFEEMPKLAEIYKIITLDNIKYHKDPLRYKSSLHKMGGKIYDSTLKMRLTYRLKRIVENTNYLRSIFSCQSLNSIGQLSFYLKKPLEYHKAQQTLNLIGLNISRNNDSRFQIREIPENHSKCFNQYYQILGINTWKLENELNHTGILKLDIKEFTASMPWQFDFLSQATGLDINSNSFPIILTKEKRFQIFIGILYRLSQEEIDFINQWDPDYSFWKRIYANDESLMGMFILSHAFRVKNHRLLLPGNSNPNAKNFWKKNVGIDYQQYPLEFIEQLAIKEDGKLNYFYTFTFFLPQDLQNIVFCNFKHEKFREIYYRMVLNKSEKIHQLSIPSLKDFSFFSLLYALKIRNNEIYFPGGSHSWANALGSHQDDSYSILKHLLSKSVTNHAIERFIPIYCKFLNRPEILNEAVIKALYDNYTDYNILIDFIEKIPLKKPETILKLISHVKSFEKLKISDHDKETYIAIFQSLLEIICENAKYKPKGHYCDQLIEKLMEISYSSTLLYDGVFKFLNQHLEISLTINHADQSFMNFLCPSLPDIKVFQQTYQFDMPNFIKKEIFKILDSQNVTTLCQLIKINHLLADAAIKINSGESINSNSTFTPINQFSPIEETNKKLSAKLDEIFNTQSHEKLIKSINQLMTKKANNSSQKEIQKLTNRIKSKYLLNALRHYLLTCAYAINLKTSKLQVLLNPNLTRFHDFSSKKGKTPWNHSRIELKLSNHRNYHLEGGLSRLNITLGIPINEDLFGREIGFKSTQGVPIIYNHLNFLPYSLTAETHEYIALMIQFCEELLIKQKEESNIRLALREELKLLSSGFHYRSLLEKIDQSTPRNKYHQPLLNYCERLKLGEILFKKKKFLQHFSKRQLLEKYLDPKIQKMAHQEIHQLGSIFFHSLGTLKPYRFNLFPQPLSIFFQSRTIGIEMINELKIKAAYLSYLEKMPSELISAVCHQYLKLFADLFFHNYRIDLHRVNFLYSTFNYLYLKKIFNDFKTKGILRIK